MKKSELKRIIREEVQKAYEGLADELNKDFDIAAIDYYWLTDDPKEVAKKLHKEFPDKSAQEIKAAIKKAEKHLYPHG